MNKGAAVLFVIFTLLFITLASRFITIQITGEAEGRVLASYADQKYTKERTTGCYTGFHFRPEWGITRFQHG